MLKKIKGLLNRWRGQAPSLDPNTADVPVVRWTDEELAAKLKTLENLPAQSWSIDDHCQAIEYLFQRYYPRSEPLLKSRFESTMAEMRERVISNIDDGKTGLPEEPTYEKRNRIHQDYSDRLNQPHEMPLLEFERVVITALQRYPFAQGLTLNTGDTHALWLATKPFHSNESISSKHVRSNARDELIGVIDEAVIDAALALRGTYEKLIQARNAGCKDATLICRNRCACLRDLLDNRTVAVAELIAEYEAGEPSIPPPITPCMAEGSIRPDCLTLMPIEPQVLLPSDDADFAKYLEATLNPFRRPLDHSWKERLTERVAQHPSSG